VKASEPVHERLRGDILAGRLAPGDPIPSERVLADEFGVGRHAVREAVKRLEQLGLVRISHGGATRVLDWRDSAGLDVLLDLFATEHTPPDLLQAALEMRATIGVDAARLCALRGHAAQRAEVRRLAAAPVDADAYGALWREIVSGAGNLAYRLAFNSLVEALAHRPELADALLPRDTSDLRALGEAIDAGEPDAAVAAAARLLTPPA
jgi:GntR family transcriptional regulator, transcriptional repressor for pyruvate dehydrogenase complex